MENKYFTPEITDIRVGYECQVLNNKNWDSIVINGINSDEDYIHTTNCSYYAAGMSSLRVPYLTKEQIEAEGWKFKITNKIRYWYYMDDTFFECPMTTGYQMMKLIMMHDPEYNAITIRAYFRGESGYMDDEAELPIIYQGYCKDINTFRTISKLLNIKNEKDNNS